MAVEEVDIEYSGRVEFSYDPESKEFKYALESYRELISGDPDTSEQELLQAVASFIVRNDIYRMMEGVGYIGIEGQPLTRTPDSGIRVKDGFDVFSF